MPEKNFYVENARLMSYGLSNIGKYETEIEIKGKEPVEELAGKLIGLGLHSTTRKNARNLHDYIHHENDFVKRAAYIGTSLSSFLEFDPEINTTLLEGLKNTDLEVKKSSIVGYGIANIAKGDESEINKLEEHVNHPDWKIRAATGLAYSSIFLGNPKHFEKFINLLKSETSPYVKVCSCWYISLAFANTMSGIEEYKNLLSMEGDDNSFFRDMACLGLGFSFLGKENKTVDSLLEERILSDPHPYVRESGCFGLSLNHFRRPSDESYKLLNKALADQSMIVRSGAALGLGISSMGLGSINIEVGNEQDPSVEWGLMISKGLAKIPDNSNLSKNDYVRWGYHIGNGFRDNITIDTNSKHIGVKEFQEQINKGMVGSGITSEREKDSFRLSFPGLYNYLVYDSFWWGLWVLSSLGNVLRVNEGMKHG